MTYIEFDVSELEKPTATVRQRKEDLEENQKILVTNQCLY